MTIPENIIYVLDTLNTKGFEAYMVGGCVRDMIMGKTPSDFDITTNALPEEILNCFADKNCVTAGMKHGTVAPIINHEAVEITTYRIDGEYKDSRHPEEVYFTKKIEEDLSRRDFTVNAMAMGKDFNVIDPFSGKTDIENKVIRCVGNAEKRFTEDALRIMRALRFSATLGFSIEEETKNAILKLYSLLSNIAKERIFTELKKLVTGKNAGKILAEYKDVFTFIMPRLLTLTEDKYFENTKRVKTEDTALSFALLFDGLSGDITGEILSSLKSDGELKRRVKTLIEEKDTDISSEIKLSHYLRKKEEKDAERLIYYRFMLGAITKDEKERLLSLLGKVKDECIRIKDLELTGTDLIKLGFSGRCIGDALEKLLDAVVCKRCENKKEELIEYIKNIK